MVPEELYQLVYQLSLENPEEFWSEKAEMIHWFKKWDRVFDKENPENPKWFEGGMLNACYNALDRHVQAGKRDKVVMRHRSWRTKKDRVITYGYLFDEVTKFAGVLSKYGIKKGDVAVILMPTIPETNIAMLACSRIGAIHCVLFGGLNASDLASRIEECEPKVIICSVVGMFMSNELNFKERLDAALKISSVQPQKCIIFCGDQPKPFLKEGRDIIWEEVINECGVQDCVPVESQHPIFYMYTSGTTGKVKAVVFETGGTTVKYGGEAQLYILKKIVLLNITEIGWMCGLTSFCYLPTILDFETVMYESDIYGGKGDRIYELIQDFKVTDMVGSYVDIRELKAKDPSGSRAVEFNMSSLNRVALSSECPENACMEYAAKVFGVTVGNLYGQTEANSLYAAFYSNEETAKKKIHLYPRCIPGIEIVAMKDDGTKAATNEIGSLLVKLPLIPGCISTLLKMEDIFKKEYLGAFPGYYDTKDEGAIMENGAVLVSGRTDDVIIVGANRMPGSNVEDVIYEHPDVIECCVVAFPDPIKWQVPLALIVCRKETTKYISKIIKEVNDLVNKKIEVWSCFKGTICVEALPKTFIGKIKRKAVKDALWGKDIPDSSPDKEILQKILQSVETAKILD